MGWYSKLLASTVPGYYVKRARAMTLAKALYEAEQGTRTYSRKRTVQGPNQATRTAPRTLREVARVFDQDNDIASGALDVLVANIVGTGVYPQPMVLDRNGDPHEAVNAQLEAMHKRWRRKPEVTWTCDELLAQRLACRTWLRDGEQLTQHIVGPMSSLTHGMDEIPYSYEMLEPDMLPMHGETLKPRNTNARIVAGVEMNAWNRPVAFHLYKEHPGDQSFFGNTARLRLDTKRVPAERVTHLKMVKRIGQVRGVSVFATVIKRLNDISEIDESERVAARVAAAFAAVIVKGEPLQYTAPTEGENKSYRELDLEPGMILDDLVPGEKVESIGSNRPNNQLIPFRADQLRATAAGMTVSYSSMSKDYNGTYSAQRQELVEQRMLYSPIWACFVATSEVPKYRNFIQAARMTGALRIPADVDITTLNDAVYSQPAVPWIQPVQEAEGWKRLIELDVETRANVQRARGHNPRDIERQRKREREKESENTVVPDQGGGQRTG